MKNKLHYAPEARRDLDDIWEYIVNDLEKITAAMNVVSSILETIDRLQDFSEIGAPLSSVVNVESDYRFLISGSYLICYRAVTSDIYIDHILYGKRDYMRILFGDILDTHD